MAEPMSNDVIEEVANEVNAELDYKAMYEDTKKKLDTVAAHKDKLYQETKKAKADREAAEMAAQRAAEEKAAKDGEFEKLWQTAKQEKEQILNELMTERKAIRTEKVQVAAMRLANDLADGDNAELLSAFVMQDLEKIADEKGALSAEVLEGIKNQYKANAKFKSLLRGSKATGGGAPGNQNATGHQTQTLSRSEFSKLSTVQQHEFVAKVRTGHALLTD